MIDDIEQLKMDAARWRALKQCNGKVHWFRKDGHFLRSQEVWSDDFGGLDAAMDAVINELKKEEA